jgi:hypothetical protein
VSLEPPTPPSGAIFELAEKAVDFVRRAVGIALDYTPETLPVLDHYLKDVPKHQPELVTLCATCAGAYFGEVARRSLGGAWQHDGSSPDQRVVLTGGVAFSPMGMAGQAVLGAEDEAYDGSFDVPEAHRAAVSDALARKADVSEDEYFSLSGRLEALTFVVDQIMQIMACQAKPD